VNGINLIVKASLQNNFKNLMKYLFFSIINILMILGSSQLLNAADHNIHYIMIKGDTTNIDSLRNLGYQEMLKENYNVSATYYAQAIRYMPAYVPTYFNLAKAYIVMDDLDSAIIVYKSILKIDSSYAEAWAGIGKMLYWKGFPKSALENYDKAIKLDPSNKEILKVYKNVEDETKLVIKGSIHSVNENEEEYNIDAIIQKYSISKRTGDHFYFSINPMIDYSMRNYTDQKEEKRWFDNTWVKLTYLNSHNKISAFVGASSSDNQLTSYGISWELYFNISKVKIKNSLMGAYDYFYYWNEVGHDYVSNTLNITYKRLVIDGTYRYAVVRNNYIWDYYEKDKNPNKLINVAMKFRIFNVPKIFLGLSHQYRNYKYQSPLYYTPYERSLYGLYFSSYHSYKKFYNYVEGFYGTDNYDVINWTGSFEIGLSFEKFSYSIGGFRFYNEFYKNYNLFFAIKAIL